jgi:hypothetical protein
MKKLSEKSINNLLNKSNQIINSLSFLTLILLNFIFIFLVYDFSFDIPFFDDFDAIGSFILNSDNKSFSSIIQNIFSQYAEHRIGFTRFISLLYFNFFDVINFKHLILIGLFGLIGIQILIYFKIRHHHYRFFLLFLSSTILLNFQYWENMMSAMTSLQNLFAPFFCLLAIYLLNKGVKFKYRLSAYIVVFLAIFTSGNGMVLLPLGFVILTVLKERRIDFLLWCIYSIIILFFYFSDYVNPPDVFGGRSDKLLIFSSPTLLVKNFTLFLTSNLQGIGFSFQHCFLIGTCLTLYVIFYSFYICSSSNYQTKNKYFYVLVFLFFMFVAFLVAINRGLSNENMLFSRYKIYSTLFIIFVFLSIIELLKNHWFIFFYSIFSFYFFYSSLPFISILYNHFNELKYSCITYYLNDSNWKGIYPPFTTHFTNAKTASNISQTLARKGFYRVPVFNDVIKNVNKSKIDHSIIYSQETLNDFSSHIKIDFKVKSINILENNYIEMKSNTSTALFPFRVDLSVKEILKKILRKPIFVNSYSVTLPKSNIDHGIYEVNMYISQSGSVYSSKLMNLDVPFLKTPQFHN